MIQDRKAVAYVCGGVQFVRLVKHTWAESHVMQATLWLGGRNDGPDSLGGATLEALADLFAVSLEDAHMRRSEILSLGDNSLI